MIRVAITTAAFEATQVEIDCAVGSNSRASSSGVRQDRTRSTICRRNSGG
jgi:hypothetical protein